MWITFNDSKSGEQTDTHAQLTTLQLPKDNRRKSKANGYKRQHSSNSQCSNKSLKSSSNSGGNLRKLIEEHYFKTQTSEWQKQEEYRCRRNRRIQREKLLARRLLITRRLYIPAVLVMLLGIVVIFASTVRTLGVGTMFWTHREVFHIVGPVVLVLGVIFLMVVAGLESKFSRDSGTPPLPEPFLHEDFKQERTVSRQNSEERTSLRRGMESFSLDDSQTRSYFNEQRNQFSDVSFNLSDSFNCSQLEQTLRNSYGMTVSPSLHSTIDQQSSSGETKYNRRSLS